MKSCRPPPPPLALQCKAVFFLWLNNKLNTAFVLVKSSVFFSLPSPSHSYLLQFIMKLFSFCCVDISLLTPWKLKSVSVKVHVSFVKKKLLLHYWKHVFRLLLHFLCFKKRAEWINDKCWDMKINNENATWWQVYWENRGFWVCSVS